MTITSVASIIGPMIKNTPWQVRAHAAGLDQEALRRIIGLSKANASKSITGQRKSGVPKYLKAAIVAWELMSPEMRAEWARIMEAE